MSAADRREYMHACTGAIHRWAADLALAERRAEPPIEQILPRLKELQVQLVAVGPMRPGATATDLA